MTLWHYATHIMLTYGFNCGSVIGIDYFSFHFSEYLSIHHWCYSDSIFWMFHELLLLTMCFILDLIILFIFIVFYVLRWIFTSILFNSTVYTLMLCRLLSIDLGLRVILYGRVSPTQSEWIFSLFVPSHAMWF